MFVTLKYIVVALAAANALRNEMECSQGNAGDDLRPNSERSAASLLMDLVTSSDIENVSGNLHQSLVVDDVAAKNSYQFRTFTWNNAWETRVQKMIEAETRKPTEGEKPKHLPKDCKHAGIATPEVGWKYCWRNSNAVLLKRVQQGYDFITIQEDAGRDFIWPLFDRDNEKSLINTIEKAYLGGAAPASVDDDGVKRFESDWLVPGAYTKHGLNLHELHAQLQAYNYHLGDAEKMCNIIQLYHSGKVEIVDKPETGKETQHFGSRETGKPFTDRPFMATVIKLKMVSGTPNILMIHGHAPHHNEATNFYSVKQISYDLRHGFPAHHEKYNEKMKNILSEYDFVIFQGDFNRNVENDEIKIQRFDGEKTIEVPLKNVNFEMTFPGFNLPGIRGIEEGENKLQKMVDAAITNGTLVEILQMKSLQKARETLKAHEYTSMDFSPYTKTFTRPDHILFGQVPGRKPTFDVERVEITVAPVKGPSSDHLPMEAFFQTMA